MNIAVKNSIHHRDEFMNMFTKFHLLIQVENRMRPYRIISGEQVRFLDSGEFFSDDRNGGEKATEMQQDIQVTTSPTTQSVNPDIPHTPTTV